jgi:hypothetical protein
MLIGPLKDKSSGKLFTSEDCAVIGPKGRNALRSRSYHRRVQQKTGLGGKTTPSSMGEIVQKYDLA